MSHFVYWYKKNLHFAVNFYAVFLLITFIPDMFGFDAAWLRYSFWGLKAVLAMLIIKEYAYKLYELDNLEKLFLGVVVIYFINLFFVNTSSSLLFPGKDSNQPKIVSLSWVPVQITAFSGKSSDSDI